MEKDDRLNGTPEQVVGNREPQRASRPAPGKVTRTSKLSPSRGAAVQRKAVAPSQGGTTAPQARSSWDLTMDPWMDAAHRGVTALAERGQDMVQAAGPIQAKGLTENPESPARVPGHGGGAAMPEEVRGKMETAFGVDFSSVRIHEGPHAEAVGALAYTQGTDIHFAPGQYQPESQRGQELLGHELTHVVQQSQGRVQATAQAKGMGINDDGALEREADEMGARAARGEQATPYSSTALGIRNALRGTAQAKAAPIQMSPQTSHFGKFIDKTYVAKANGVDMVLEFEPNTKVEADKIGLSQSIKETAGGAPDYIEPTQEGRIVPSGPGAGYRMDRFSTQNNPIYGSGSVAAGDGLDKTKSTNAPAGVTPSPANATYELGHRKKAGTGWDTKNAWLKDTPRGSSMNDAGQVFETTALVLDGTMKDTYLGSVQWGWERDRAGTYKSLDFKLVSQGVPSQDFLAAAEQFNNSTTQGTILTKKDDTQVYQRSGGSLSPWFKVAKGVTATIVGEPIGTTIVYSNVSVKDGTVLKTGYIQVKDLTDKGDGGATVNLPIVDAYRVSNPSGTGMDTGGSSVFLPANTRLKITDGSKLSSDPTSTDPLQGKARVEVVDGALIGQTGWVDYNDLQDENP